MEIGWSQFALDRHKYGAGYTFFHCKPELVCEEVKRNWHNRFPGQGETTLERKVVVPMQDIDLFSMSTIKLRLGIPVKAEVVERQPGEDPFIETFVDLADFEKIEVPEDFKGPIHYKNGKSFLGFETPKYVNIVCYSVEALLENNGTRTTDKEWEIVAVLGSNIRIEPMTPLTQARNFLEKVGGTKSIYTAQEFAESIYFHATQRGIKVRRSSQK
jgi:hypothetical protein